MPIRQVLVWFPAALPQKSGLRLIYRRFNALKQTILVSFLTFEAKPVSGEPLWDPGLFVFDAERGSSVGALTVRDALSDGGNLP